MTSFVRLVNGEVSMLTSTAAHGEPEFDLGAHLTLMQFLERYAGDNRVSLEDAHNTYVKNLLNEANALFGGWVRVSVPELNTKDAQTLPVARAYRVYQTLKVVESVEDPITEMTPEEAQSYLVDTGKTVAVDDYVYRHVSMNLPDVPFFKNAAGSQIILSDLSVIKHE